MADGSEITHPNHYFYLSTPAHELRHAKASLNIFVVFIGYIFQLVTIYNTKRRHDRVNVRIIISKMIYYYKFMLLFRSSLRHVRLGQAGNLIQARPYTRGHDIITTMTTMSNYFMSRDQQKSIKRPVSAGAAHTETHA